MSSPEEKAVPPLTAPSESLDMSFPSTLECCSEVEAAAEALAHRAGFDEDTASNIAMVTREAIINAVKHGNHFAPEKQVKATLQRFPGAVRLCIADQGESFNPDALPDPLDPNNLLRTSGRGVFLMRALMDEVDFRPLHPGTEVTLIKRKSAGE